MDTSPQNRIKIIGVGNAWRGDDAAGLLAARYLKQKHLNKVEIAENLGTANAIADAWQNTDKVIVVDAVVSGGFPGDTYRFDAHNPATTFPLFRSTSSHHWGLSEAVALGRLFQELPPILIIYGIEGEKFDMGDEVSPAVAAAIPKMAERILQEVQSWLRLKTTAEETSVVESNRYESLR